MANFSFTGTIINHLTEPVPQVNVEIYDLDTSIDWKGKTETIKQLIWSGTTDNDGKYSGTTDLNWNNKLIDILSLYFIIKKDGKELKGLIISIDKGSNEKLFVPIIWPFDLLTPLPIKGIVIDVLNKRIKNATVKLFHFVSPMKTIVTATTNSNGEFEVDIPIPDIRLVYGCRVEQGYNILGGVFKPGLPIIVYWDIPLLPWKIIDHGPNSYKGTETQTRLIPGIPNSSKSINIFNFSSENSNKGHFNGPGKRYTFQLRNNIIEYQTAKLGEEFEGTWYPFQKNPNNGMTTFHTSRDGKIKQTPKFDMFTANGNRLFAKEAKTDRLFMTTIDHLFWNYSIKDLDYEAISTAIFFKLDPELGNILTKDKLVSQLKKSVDYKNHPSALRYDLYKIFLPNKVVDLGMMIVNHQPKHWYHIDSRPPPRKKMLENYPVYQDIKYRCTSIPNLENIGFSIDYKKILSLGIGSTHWHEQYSNIHGGEIQPAFDKTLLSIPNPYNAINTTVYVNNSSISTIKFSDLYRFANGPVDDGDGFIDGTVNYYILCELNHQDDSVQKYAILTIDEQFYFSYRWRAVGIDDYDPKDMFEGTILHTVLADDDTYHFEKKKFWDPFKKNCINGYSRLAVSKQVLIVNGIQNGKHYLYSINYSYSTMDRSWRRRKLPSENIDYLLGHPGHNLPHAHDPDAIKNPANKNSVNPKSIFLRDDMTIILEGTKSFTVNGRSITYRGRYYQKYLPSTLKYPELGTGSNYIPDSFDHQWQFVKEFTYQKMEQYSHFGIYEKVDDRHQYYELTMEPSDISKLDKKILWKDHNNQLKIDYYGINWKAINSTVNAFLDCFLKRKLFSNTNYVKFKQQPLSMYNHDGTYFKVYDKSLNGSNLQIAIFADKRDDDLMSATNDSSNVELVNSNDTNIKIEPIFNKHFILNSPPQVEVATFTIHKHVLSELITSISISFSMTEEVYDRRSNTMLKQDINKSIYKIKVGIPGIDNILFDLSRDQFEYKHKHYVYKKENLTLDEKKLYEKYCTKEKYWKYGTSIWFEDILGQKNIAEHTKYIEAKDFGPTSERLRPHNIHIPFPPFSIS